MPAPRASGNLPRETGRRRPSRILTAERKPIDPHRLYGAVVKAQDFLNYRSRNLSKLSSNIVAVLPSPIGPALENLA
jgi:hypothetical protein